MSALAPPPHETRDPDLADDLARTALALARRIAAGATLWCVAPSAPAHAAHLAVEFLHPVIMGKRAVPAVAVEGPDVRGTLRGTVRRGDVVLMLGASGEAELHALARRGEPWGVTTIWFVTDSAPQRIDADHVLHVGTTAAASDATVALVLAYHLLWELTHVVFEHPGLLHVDPADEPEVCTTCADEGRLAEVDAVADDEARVRIDGATSTVAADLVEALEPGDLVLVHAGVVIARVEELP